MKRKLLVAFGVASPIVLLLICAAFVLMIGVAGWLLAGPDEQSRLIRIMSLAPLETPESENIVAQTEAGAPAQPAAPQPGIEPQPAPAAGQSDADFSAPETIESARGFSLPAGSVNSITREGVATRLVIPKLNLDAPVVLSPIENETWKVDHLGEQMIGHLEGTAPPGSNSNIVLAAHVTVSAGVYGPFAELARLSSGDEIFVYYGEQTFKYVVDGWQTVDRTAVDVTFPTDTGQITLITCSNWNNQESRYIERLVVKGYLDKS